jgi:3-oxoacyl-[acyl-carrier protein] reductase
MTAAMAERLKEIVPLKRIGQPAEIAALASWLAGDEAGYMTGASLTIDGGYVL